jgi:perosamine synthetase
MKKIPVAGPSITEKEINCVTDAVTRCWYGEANFYHDKFEALFREYLGVKHAAALPSCTSAIHLALAAHGINTGDEVIVPELTWIASAAPVNYVGAETVFADVNSETWCLCPDSVEAAITPRTKALIPVDLYGNMADYDRLRAIADKHGLLLIEDAAEAVGASFHGRRAGSLGHAGVFSFHGSKTLTTGEGGMLVTDDTKLFERALYLRDHGRPPGDTEFQNTDVAFKYKMSSLQAALGYAQLSRIDELIETKRRAFSWYRDRLQGIPGVSLNNPGPGVEAAYWMATIVWDERHGFDKRHAATRLREQGIDTRPIFSPLSSLPAYRNRAEIDWKSRNPTSYRIGQSGLNLPSSLLLAENEADLVCRAVQKLFAA